LSYQVLFRKWRPNKFDDVKGQDHVVRTLKNSIINNRIAPAYLFSGSRGVGKTSIARILAKAICCPNQKDGEPCNECPSCVEITRSACIDVQEIDGASNNGVDSIREIRENIMYPPSSTKYKIYIIDEVHMLSNSAFNALLKTLEEPPAHGVFIFATTEPHKILQTIVSRCQAFDFKKLSIEDIVSTISDVAAKEEITTSQQALYTIARESRGSLRDSLSILDQVVSFAGKNFDQEEIKSILGFIDRGAVFEIIKSIVNKESKPAISIARKMFAEAYDVKKITDTMVEVFRDLLFVKHGLSEILAESLPDYELKELSEIATKTSVDDVEQFFYMANNSAEEIARSPYPSLIFEVSVLSMCNKQDSEDIKELVASLKSQDLPQVQTTEKKKSIEPQKYKTDSNTILQPSANTQPSADTQPSAASKTIPSPKPTVSSQVIAAPKTQTSFEWNDVVNRIFKNNKDLGDILMKGRYTGLHNNKAVVIDYSDYPEMISKFQDPELLKLIQDTIYEICGNIYVVEIASRAVMQRMSKLEDKKKSLLEKEMVKTVIAISGAKVKDVKLY
jgi:DNA polymerase III subunit gamma/tau